MGGYVWSPKLDKSGKKNAGYTMMTKVKKYDFILHNCNGKIVSISITKSDCYDCKKPKELFEAFVDWNEDGYRIDLEYFDLDQPLLVTKYKAWLESNYKKDSAFTIKGTGKQQYMCLIDNEHAIFLLEKALELQVSKKIICQLKGALSDIISDTNSEYDFIDKNEIECLLNKNYEDKPEWNGKKCKQEMTFSSVTGREVPKRNLKVATDALRRTDYLCEFDKNDKTFLRENGSSYTEPHHLIPISKYNDFNYSVDVMENIVSLCSNCHNLLHYGRFEDKIPILKKIYEDRKLALEKVGLEITFDQLIKYYGSSFAHKG